MRIAEMLPADQAGGSLWPLMRQAGVTDAVGTLPGDPRPRPGEDAPWDYLPMVRAKDLYERNGRQEKAEETRVALREEETRQQTLAAAGGK